MFSRPRFLMGLAAGLFGAAAVTVIFSRLVPVQASAGGFFFLMVVLATATFSGFAAASLVSVASMLCYDFFFLPPVGRLTIAAPEDWVALFTFLFTALVASHLSDRAQKQTGEAQRSQQETERLYALSRAILLTDAARPIGPQAAQSIAQIFESPSVTILDSKANAIYKGGPADMEGAAADLEFRLHEVVRQGDHQRFEAQDLDIWPIALGGSPIGALAMAGARVGSRSSDGAVQSILNLVAIALERVRTEEAVNKAEVARQSEEFKSTLLDGIAHEFKTPLTSIKAAVTGLEVAGWPQDQRELASIIDEETDRLSQLVTEAVKMAEIDAHKVTPQRAVIEVADLIRTAISTFAGRGAERILVNAADRAASAVEVDPDMLVLALRQLLDNALKYAEPGSEVRVNAKDDGDRVMICVADSGPGIPERERERIFEKFFRRSGVRNRLPGSGLGLHIAREIARIHGGDLWVETAAAGGSEFCLAMPCAPKNAMTKEVEHG